MMIPELGYQELLIGKKWNFIDNFQFSLFGSFWINVVFLK